jgi:hypothetical protein
MAILVGDSVSDRVGLSHPRGRECDDVECGVVMPARRNAMLAGACASAWIASAYAPTPARADDLLRVVIVSGPRDAALVERVEGQVADLDATLERDLTAMPSSPLPVQLVTARRVARTHTADVVVWVWRSTCRGFRGKTRAK